MILLDNPVLQGARNLLVNCAGTRAGDRLLIVHEPPHLSYYDQAIVKAVAECGRGLGADVHLAEVAFDPSVTAISDDLNARIAASDQTVFLARIGDQLRFRDVAGDARIVVSYALDAGMLGSGFGTAHYGAFDRLRRVINQVVADAEHIRITCPRGTDCHGAAGKGAVHGDVTVRRFPMPVFAPVPAEGFSGRVALPGFLVGTGSRYYAPYAREFDGKVFVHFESGRISAFTGDAAGVVTVREHYRTVSALFGIDGGFVHSWHAGIHPGCAFPRPASESYERWSGAAFGNPRLLHFHTCGAYAPGEISWNVVDPTITIDGIAVWEDGVLHAERLPGGAEILREFPDAAALFRAPSREIGL